MSDSSFLSGYFLIAMPNLQDPNFLRSVTYICEHNADGAFGIVINRPLEATIGEILAQLDIKPVANNPYLQQKVFMGGPVEMERGLILHKPEGDWKATLVKIDGMAVTSSLDIMRAIAADDPPDKFLVSIGYAGWGAGQLEQELADNAWLYGPADPSIMFDLPVAQRWDAAARLLGVDLTLLSSDIGHA